MRIAWFTPYSLNNTIGGFSETIVMELSRFAEVDLWHPEVADERPTHVARNRFRRASDLKLRELPQYDLVFYNLGDDFSECGEIWKVSEEIPGVVILHDSVMHHFFATYYLEQLQDPHPYISAMELAYGEKGRMVAEHTVNADQPRIWETDAMNEYPLLEHAIRGSYGVIAHSDSLGAKLQKGFPGLVTNIPFVYETEGDSSDGLIEQAGQYVQELMKFHWRVRGNKPILNLANRISQELNAIGVTKDMKIAETMTNSTYDLFFGD
jgi:hypothetical protein